MSTSRILHRVIIILGCAVFGASVGVCWQALRFTAKPSEFRSLAKLVAGGQVVTSNSPEWRDQHADFYGTIIETLESAEMKRRAFERVRALNPDLKDADVDIRVGQTKGSAIFNILASGRDPKYTRIFLDALLDEFIAFRQNIREQSGGKALQDFLEAVVSQQKKMEETFEAAEQAQAKVEALSAKAEGERLVTRMTKLKDQRDDLRLELRTMAEDDAARASLERRLTAVEEEIAMIEAERERRNININESRHAVEKHAVAKLAYEKLLESAQSLQSSFSSGADSVAIQERASVAAEFVEDWRLPIAIGALGGGLLGAALGLLLSLIIVHSSPPPLPP